jgi:hypothetical protein
VTPTMLLNALAGAGVCLSRAGDDLRYQTRPGVSIAPYVERIRQDKPGLLTELRLREQIIAAVDVDPQDFNREEHERLTAAYAAHERNLA